MFPHLYTPVEAPAPASLGTCIVMPRMSITLTVSKLANQPAECLTFPQYMDPDNATSTVCTLRSELCQPHYSARLMAGSFSRTRVSIVTNCCCNSISFYQNTHSKWTSTCCVMLFFIILKTNRVPQILNTLLIPPSSYCQVFYLLRTYKC